MWIPSFLLAFVEKTVLSPLNCLNTVKHLLTRNVRIYFWTLSSLPLVYIPVRMPVQSHFLQFGDRMQVKGEACAKAQGPDRPGVCSWAEWSPHSLVSQESKMNTFPSVLVQRGAWSFGSLCPALTSGRTDRQKGELTFLSFLLATGCWQPLREPIRGGPGFPGLCLEHLSPGPVAASQSSGFYVHFMFSPVHLALGSQTDSVKAKQMGVVRPQLVPAPLRPLLPRGSWDEPEEHTPAFPDVFSGTSSLITHHFLSHSAAAALASLLVLPPQGLCLRSSLSLTLSHGPCPHFAQVSIWRPSSSETGLCTSPTVCPHFSLITYPSYNLYAY